MSSEAYAQDGLTRAMDLFVKTYGYAAKFAAIAPGRVNLIGEHVDYCDGLVLPMAIPIYTVVVGAPNKKSACHVVTSGEVPKGQSKNISFQLPININKEEREKLGWASYVAGVAQLFCAKTEYPTAGFTFDAAVDSSIPLGGGLSSSAALEVATLLLVSQLTPTSKRTLSHKQKALLCQQAEHEFAGVPCGIMDQYVVLGASAGRAFLIDCRSLDFKTVQLNSDRVAVLVTNSNVKHQLAGSEYSTRREQCESAAKLLNKDSLRDVTLAELKEKEPLFDPVVYKRALHVVSEIGRVQSAVKVLSADDFQTFGALMNESHQSLRDLFQVSCDELDQLVEIARSVKGVYGSRMTGGGFGGCTVTLVEKDKVDDVKQAIETNYKTVDGKGATFYECIPVGGAKVLSI